RVPCRRGGTAARGRALLREEAQDMIRGRSAALGMAFSLASTVGAQGVQKAQPPPQFTSGYTVPSTPAPLPRADVFSLVDIGLLVAVMGLGAWLVLAKRSRREVRVLTLFAVLYFGFYRLGCVCAIGSIQNVVYAAAHSDYRLPVAVAAFFTLPLLAALFFGRVFCGVACPMGALQDLVLIRPLKVKAQLDGLLGTIPYLYLGAAVAFAALGTAFVICEYDPFVTIFRINGHLPMVLVAGATVLLSTVVGRPYCRYLCPYGVLLRWASVFARHRVRITPEECLNCHLCAQACPYGAIVPPSTGRREPAQERKRVLSILALTLVVAVAMGFAVARLSPTLARWDPRVVRAWELREEQENPRLVKTKMTEAWTRHARPVEEAYREAAAVERNYALAMPLLAVWFALVVGLRALALGFQRQRPEYETDAGACVHCARCYVACPVPNRPRYAGLRNLLEGRP
ncbi:MAG TPA: 4Fe-4S binding protein, partial [Fimbriimonas sp.]